MGRAKKQVSAEKERAAEEQRRLAHFLSGTHETLRLWRMCKTKACRRNRTCFGDVDECGARCCPEGWAWVHRVLQTIRDGQSRRAAMRAADQHAAGGSKRVTVHFGFGEPAEFVVGDDGKWTLADGPRQESKFGTQFKRLTGSGSVWLGAAPGGEGKT
jgi:hypothetical protein